MKRGALPWITLAVAGSAAASYLLPELSSLLVYDRERVLSGELWRLATAPLVHFSASHLGWNLAVLVAAGWIAEGADRRRYMAVLALSTFLHALWLLLFEPRCLRFGGLSGIATGILAWIALEEIRQGRQRRAAGIALLLLTAGKLVSESLLDHSLFADLGTAAPAAPAHWIGALAGLVACAAFRRSSA